MTAGHQVTVHENRAPSAATAALSWLHVGQGQTSDWDVQNAITYQYYANVVVYAAIRAIAQDLASLDFRAGDDPDKVGQYNKNARLAKLLGPEPGSPNEEISVVQFWQYTVAQLYLGGFFAWELELARGSSSDIVAIWPLVSSAVKPIPSQDPRYYFSGVQYTVRGSSISFDRSRSLYYWRPAQDDIRQAESPLRAARLDVSVMVLQDRYDYAFLQNDARPAAVIVHEAFSIRAERDAWRERFMMEHQGPENAGKIHWVETQEGGAAPKDAFDVKTLGLSQVDAEFIKRYDQKLRGVVMALGVPMSRLGDSSERTFSNADKEYEIYRKNVLIPLAKELSSIVNRKLAPRLGSEIGWFDLRPFQTEEQHSRVRGQALPDLLKHRVIMFNEAREALGLSPVDGGDRFMSDEELALLQQGAVTLLAGAAPIPRTEKDPLDLEIGSDIEPPKPEPQPALPAADPTAALPPAPADAKNGGQVEVPKESRSPHEQRSLKAYRKVDKKVTAHEARFENRMQEIFDRQLKITLDRLEGKRGRKMLAEFRSVAATSTVFDHDFWQTETSKELLGMYEDIYVDALNGVPGAAELGFDVKSPFATEFIEARANQLAWNVTQTTYDAINEQLSEGASLGESIPDIAKRIRNLFDQTYASRAQTVARTEVISAYNGSTGNIGANLPDDVIAGQEWLATPGPRTRASHSRANNQRIRKGEPFMVGGHALMYPGDPAGPAKEVVNCRCALLLLTPQELDELGGFSETRERRSNPTGYNQYKHMNGGSSVKVNHIRGDIQRERKGILKELDDQGVDEMSPIRHIFASSMGNQVAVVRDHGGKVVGGVQYDVDRGDKEVVVTDMRMMQKRMGHGTAAFESIAKVADEKGFQLKVTNAVGSAKPFYAKLGANFQHGHGTGAWTPAGRSALAAGKPIHGGDHPYDDWIKLDIFGD